MVKQETQNEVRQPNIEKTGWEDDLRKNFSNLAQSCGVSEEYAERFTEDAIKIARVLAESKESNHDEVMDLETIGEWTSNRLAIEFFCERYATRTQAAGRTLEGANPDPKEAVLVSQGAIMAYTGILQKMGRNDLIKTAVDQAETYIPSQPNK